MILLPLLGVLLVAPASADDDTSWHLSLAGELSSPNGWVQVRENAIEGTRLHFGSDLNVNDMETIRLQAWKPFSDVSELHLGFSTSQLDGHSSTDVQVYFNGTTIAPDLWFNDIPGAPQSVNGHNYQVTGVDAQGLAVQTAPHIGNVDHYVANNTTLVVVCQTKNGDQVDGAVQYGRPFRTWDQLYDGTYVYDWYMNTPVVATNGYSPGIVPCVGG